MDFSFYSMPQEGGSVIGAEAVYRWSASVSTTLRVKRESLNYDYDYEDYHDMLAVVYEEDSRLDLLAVEANFKLLSLSLGGLWFNNSTWEKGFLIEAPESPLYSYEEELDFNLLAPRLGLSGRFGRQPVRFGAWAVVSPVFWVTQEQQYNWKEGSTTPGTDATSGKETHSAVGMGFLGLDGGLDIRFFDLILLVLDASNYSYNVEEYRLNVAGAGSDAGGNFTLVDKNYQRFKVAGSLSLLLPLPMGKVQLGGSLLYRNYSSSEDYGGYEEWSWGLILGFR
jgi:hypothetical protein